MSFYAPANFDIIHKGLHEKEFYAMKEMSGWLVNVEEIAMRFYEKAAMRFADDKPLHELLKALEADEKMHFSVVGKANELLEDSGGMKSAVTVDAKTRDTIIEYLQGCEKKLDSGAMTKDELMDAIVAIEYSENNDVFLYLMSAFRNYLKTLLAASTNIKQHKGQIERFIRARPEYSRLLARVAAIPEVGRENILVLEEDEMMLEAFNVFLGEQGIIDAAKTGDEALERLKDKYYACIVTDVNVATGDGIEFYKKAVERFPGINKRFLFLTEYDCDYLTFLENNGLRYFEKPSSIKDIKAAVSETIRASANYVN